MNAPRIIRPYRDADLLALHRLLTFWEDPVIPPQTLARQIRRFLDAEQNQILLAESAGNAVGYCQLADHTLIGMDSALEIVALLVHPDYRGQGIGSELLRAAETQAREQGYALLMLSSQTHRKRAHALYRRAGFEEWKQSLFFKKSLG